jgi:hypothetical protein
MKWGVTMGRRSLTVLAVLVAVLGAALALWGSGGTHGQGASTPASAHSRVVEYLRALEARDRSGILELVPDDYDAAGEADERLQRLGGAHAKGAHIRLTAEFSPDILSVSIRTTGADGREVAWTENLFWRDGEWWLVLGGRGDGRPASDTRRPAP